MVSQLKRGIGRGRGDYRYLSQPRGDGTAWYAVAEVPRKLREVLGKKRLMLSLKTADVRLARVVRWKAIETLKTQIANARNPNSTDDAALTLEAMAYRENYVRADAQRRDDLLYEIAERAEEIDRAHGGTGSDRDPYEFEQDEATPLPRNSSS